jgi:hypothetical protein
MVNTKRSDPKWKVFKLLSFVPKSQQGLSKINALKTKMKPPKIETLDIFNDLFLNLKGSHVCFGAGSGARASHMLSRVYPST